MVRDMNKKGEEKRKERKIAIKRKVKVEGKGKGWRYTGERKIRGHEASRWTEAEK